MTEFTQNISEEVLEEVLEEKLEEVLEEAKPSIWKQIQTGVMMIAALMLSAGQFNDTKDLATSVYEATVATFTHKIEYELIDKINVGKSVEYIKSLIGEPYVIKHSKIQPELKFHYYTKDKFDLTLISDDGRLVGYTVFTKRDGFAPKLPFAGFLGEKKLQKISEKPKNYNFDIGNLIYYLESQELGKQQMFLTLVRGYVEYGAIATLGVIPNDYRNKLASSIDKLERAEMFSDRAVELSDALNAVRNVVYPNFYAITELKSTVIAETLLTRYEYQMLTNS